jgi:hypothetical protein
MSDQDKIVDLEDTGGIVEEQVVQTDDGSSYVKEKRATEIVRSPHERRELMARRTRHVIYFITHTIAIFTAIRLVLQVLDANPENGFVVFVTIITSPFTAPFNGLFGPAPPEYPIAASSLLFAIPIYYLFAWIIGRITTFAMMRTVPPAAASD